MLQEHPLAAKSLGLMILPHLPLYLWCYKPVSEKCERPGALQHWDRFPRKASCSVAETRKSERSNGMDSARFSQHYNCSGLDSHAYPAMNHGNNPVHARALLPHVPARTSYTFMTVWIASRAVQHAARSLLQYRC